jgi:CheY-like chemotaxis protein
MMRLFRLEEAPLRVPGRGFAVTTKRSAMSRRNQSNTHTSPSATPRVTPASAPVPAPGASPATAKIRVLCVDDSHDLTSILGQCIGFEPDMMSVGALRSANDLVKQVDALRPDVVLLDMTMPGINPLAALSQLTSARGGSESVRVILFSGSDDHRVATAGAHAGACGFLSKHAEVPMIIAAIREAARWRKGVDPFVVWN